MSSLMAIEFKRFTFDRFFKAPFKAESSSHRSRLLLAVQRNLKFECLLILMDSNPTNLDSQDNC